MHLNHTILPLLTALIGQTGKVMLKTCLEMFLCHVFQSSGHHTAVIDISVAM